MKTLKNKIENFLVVIGSFVGALAIGTQALGQVPMPPVRPPFPTPALARVLPTKLGSSTASAQRWSPDLADLVKGAMPAYQDLALMNQLKGIKERYGDRGPDAKLSADVLKQLFLLDIREGEGQTEKGGYSFYPNRGEVTITKDLFIGYLLNEIQAKYIMKSVQDQHRDLLKRIGVGADQVYAMNMHLRNVDIGKDAGNGRIESEGPAKTEGFLTYVTRAVEGLIVEGSYLKIFSHDEKGLAGLSARWPLFKFHPELRSFELKTKGALQEEIITQAKKVLNSKHEYNVKLAVVLRPATVRQQIVFVPALKVGIFSRPPGGDEKSIMNGEAGERFFVTLVKQNLPEDESNTIERRE